MILRKKIAKGRASVELLPCFLKKKEIMNRICQQESFPWCVCTHNAQGEPIILSRHSRHRHAANWVGIYSSLYSQPLKIYKDTSEGKGAPKLSALPTFDLSQNEREQRSAS